MRSERAGRERLRNPSGFLGADFTRQRPPGECDRPVRGAPPPFPVDAAPLPLRLPDAPVESAATA